MELSSLRQSLCGDVDEGAQQLSAILDHSFDAFLCLDSSLRIRIWNTAASQVFGWSREEIIGERIHKLLPKPFRKQLMKGLAQQLSGCAGMKAVEATRETIAFHQNGRHFPVEFEIFTVKEGNGDPIICAFIRDLAELKRLQDQERLVQERTVKLTESNTELKQFAKIASHDLQEPLKTVQGFVHLLKQTNVGRLDSESEEFIECIYDATQRMQHLIQSVLLHSQIADSKDLRPVTDCEKVLAQVLDGLKASIDATDAQVIFGKMPNVAVPHTQAIQLFQNLISNAIKFRTSESPRIQIAAERTTDTWLFSVRDNSIGIEPQYLDRIFDMFSRLNSRSKYEGAGIGLAICKQRVTIYGREMWAESKPGEGSVFLFTLPAIEQQPRRTKVNQLVQILLVEDTPSDVRLTQEALKRSNINCNLSVANDGVEAMEYLIARKTEPDKLPHIILLDLNMPRKNGHEVLAEIESDVELKKIPVILLTVSERDEDVLEALRLKMNYYLAKPVTSEKISVLIRSIYELHADEHNAAPGGNEEIHVKFVLAGNPHTSAIALTRLADDASARVRRRVAENPNVPKIVLAKLALDQDNDVRLSITENPNTPDNVLESLANDASDDVRMGMASNRRTPVSLLQLLANDENVYVSANAKKTLSAEKSD